MNILCPGAGMAVAVQAGGGSGSMSGTICAHGTINSLGVSAVYVKVYPPNATPDAGDATSGKVASISASEWCAEGVPCSAGGTAPGVSLKLAAFFIVGTATNIVTQPFTALDASVGGTDCCQSGLCGSGSAPAASGIKAGAVAKGDKGKTFPPPPPPMATHKG